MSTTDFTLIKGKSGVRAADFIAFVADRQTEQVLKSFVLEQAMPHAHIAVGNIDEAIAYVSKIDRAPQFLLVDLHDSVMPLFDLGRLAEVCEQSVQVIGIGERNDVGLFRSLLKLGVHDYLVKPLTVELLKRTVNTADGKVAPVTIARTGKTIAFTGTRGGVGVTTVALNLARHLADDTHRRVAYVDLNLTGGAANSMLGTVSNNGLAEVLQNSHRLDPQYVERTLVAKGTRLFMLTADLDYGAERNHSPEALARVMEILGDSFHYVFVDIADPSDPLAQQAFDHAARVYVVTDRSVHSTRETIRLLRHIEDRDNNPPSSILLNNPNAAIAGKVQPSDFMSAVGRSILHEIQFEQKALATAENLGEAPTEKAQNGFTQSISRIANDLTGQQAQPERSLLSKFRLRRG
ncbi:Type II/IV secretion system ATPase TadZ/CpaE, associated with Flp pilus assembly [Candidatus Burkholderia verschuerenii]|uniref:Type II/IV secretion system ATPase TadZ/CpaE, associated with Flp pilus assembly n=1 Tax=Candidatus Burkholderia verschuerenii TaxID=242163 RepID=A0A0L0MC22_9BURK|nr:AAA family ATPase [Candidatus Burkholderia verschuerenii]KND59898.1 Type II/IV secretion system ATPase TadZ/CpaE, associated with Flp pilus assembly [Candidatus Burkholderia verschuerenii]